MVLEFLDDTLVRISLPTADCPSDTAHKEISKRWEDALTPYLEGKLLANELPAWSLQASAFQTQVLQYLLEATTPGQVLTYQQLALTLFNSSNHTRAVARSLASNPLPLIFPCHRVMGSGQVWKGYALGRELWLKLTTLENQLSMPLKA